MSWANKQHPNIVSGRATLAATTEYEIPVFSAKSNQVRILNVGFVPDAAQVHTTSVGYAIYAVNKGTAGTLASTIGVYGDTALAGTVAAAQRADLTLTGSLTTLSAREVLAIKKATLGSGTFNGWVNWFVEYMDL